MFRTDLLSIIRSLNTLYTEIGVCHAEILKVGKITSVCTFLYLFNVFLTVHHELTIQYINYQPDALIIIYS